MDIKKLEDLQVAHHGITLNMQDIDLMLIAGANNLEELQNALSIISNIKIPIEQYDISDEDFHSFRQWVYESYLDNLTPLNYYLKDKQIEIKRKIEYLKAAEILTAEELALVIEITKTSSNKEEMIVRLNEQFEEERIHQMYAVLREFSPIEKEGIKSTTIEATQNLLEIIKRDYNSITIDEEAKYGKIVLQDGSFDFKYLQKSLDFAKSLDKQVRLNTLLFYMDCPEELYQLEKTPENKQLVKQKLGDYVDATTSFIRDNGYKETVRSIDVFNELLNRFPLQGEIPYKYRGEIPQDPDNDNTKSGWLKHLDMSNLCDVIALTRQNLPDTDFMYNDDNLVDKDKLAATVEIIRQIRENEKRLGVKLIDSIGTQMHIDNGVSKQDITDMFMQLAEFGLPIEITEFDIAMTHVPSDMSEEQIELLRQEKINEVYAVVDELKGKCNIRGLTIWSKTDKQNFRVMLANEQRLKQGLPPIHSLHGGYYTEEMEPKEKLLGKKYNYHTHTKRCGHTGNYEDRDFVEYAKQAGITQLGFSDHIPVSDLEYQDVDQSMHINEAEEYIESINKLKEENPDMTILCGFEAEYNPMKDQFLCKLRDKVDYMILGQHYVPSGLKEIPKENNPDYPIQYAKMVCKAMDSGIFDIVAHPDIFMKYRDSLETEEDKRLFMENATIASWMICQKAKELNIPLELNLTSVNLNNKMSDGEYAYPYSSFWQAAAESGAPVLYGVDTHHPEAIMRMEEQKQEIARIVNARSLNLVQPNYNPVEARKHNRKLNELYVNTKRNALTYETNMITGITTQILSNIPDEELNPDSIDIVSEAIITKYIENCEKKFKGQKDKIEEKEQETRDNQKNTASEKQMKLERYRTALERCPSVHDRQIQALEQARATIKIAVQIGCQSKEDIRSTVTQITERNTTTDENKRRKIDQSLLMRIRKNEKETLRREDTKKEETRREQTKTPVLVKRKNDNNSNNGNRGSVDSTTLSLIITILFSISVIVGYTIYKLNIG